MNTDRSAELEAIVRSSPWFMRALGAAQALQLPSWCIGAGAVRTLVWDRLHGYASPSHLADVDLAYFDASEPPDLGEQRQQARIVEQCPELPWEVTNQAHVHLWYARNFGQRVEPVRSLPEAVATWPEYATTVGISLRRDGSLEIIAPYGLEDLFAMRVRRNPTRVSLASYRERIASKRYLEHWPLVQIATE